MRVSNYLLASILILWFNANSVFAGEKITREEYLNKYRMVAVQDMLSTGVPASITLAQASLESENGNSPLAVDANNHFGIKCHDWTGSKYYHDDDAKQECFRHYTSALESFDDHSKFLRNRPRYAFLFDLPKTDYKAWATGLKQAGYATNPEYAERLIKIIEDNKLYELDKVESMKKIDKLPEFSKSEKNVPSFNEKKTAYNNGIQYTVAQKGDSYDKIAEENGMRAWQLFKYNDLPKNAIIKEGQRIYLKPKKRRPREEFHIIQQGETMYTVSQRYGVKIKFLYKRNLMKAGEPVKLGQKIWLRSKKEV